MPFKCRSFKVLLVAGTLCVAVVIAVVSWIEADRQDRRFLKTQLDIAAYEVGDVYKDLEGRLIARAYRDNTYDHIVRKWDAGWINTEMNTYLRAIGVHLVAIFDRDGNVRYMSRGMHDYAINAAQLTAGKGIAPLISPISARSGEPPRIRKGLVVIDDRVFFAATSRITPVAGKMRTGDPAYTLLFLEPAKKSHFYALILGFKAENVHVSVGPHRHAGEIELPLKDAAGRTLAHLAWRTPKPGASILWVLLPVLAAMFLLQAAVLVIYIGRWRQAQQTILEHQARMEAARMENRAKAMFIGNISHELRTPLNAVLGFAEMLQMQVFGPLGSPRYKEYADHIMSSGRDMLNMVNDLIEIVRIRSSDTAKERDAVNVSECLHHVVERALPAARKKSVRLPFDRDGPQLWCVGSEISLKTALAKLYATAIELTDSGDEITVAVGEENGETVIRIHDPSPTPPADVLDRINTDQYLFSQDHLVTRDGSTGLNFEIARGLVQLMGGTLKLLAGAEGGVVAEMRLPATPPPDGDAEPAAARQQPASI